MANSKYGILISFNVHKERAVHGINQIGEQQKSSKKRKKILLIAIGIAAYPVKALIVYYTGLWSLMVWLFFEHLLPLLITLGLLP